MLMLLAPPPLPGAMIFAARCYAFLMRATLLAFVHADDAAATFAILPMMPLRHGAMLMPSRHYFRRRQFAAIDAACRHADIRHTRYFADADAAALLHIAAFFAAFAAAIIIFRCFASFIVSPSILLIFAARYTFSPLPYAPLMLALRFSSPLTPAAMMFSRHCLRHA